MTRRGAPDYEYWAVQGPGDEHPEMIFRNEEWARSAVEDVMAGQPQMRTLLRIFRVRVTYEER
jgi:hypothetical protein